MKRSARALGAVAITSWLAGAPIAAQEAATDPGAEAVPASAPAPAAAVVIDEPPRHAKPRLFGELLFVKPTLDDTTFVVRSPTGAAPPRGQRENDDFAYEPAFRIGAGYALASGRELELSYSYLDANASETVRGDFLWATRGSPDFGTSFEAYPGSASADIDASYQRLDAHVTQPWRLADFEDLDLGLVLGLEWADFRVGEHYVYDNRSPGGGIGRVSAASRSWGIGPELGLDLGYAICDVWMLPGTFSLKGDASIGVLFSETNTRASSSIFGTPQLAVQDDETSRLLAVIHARVGVGYAVPIAHGVLGTLDVGYQLDSYLRGLARSEFVDDTARGKSSTDYFDFDLQGVYASFGVVF